MPLTLADITPRERAYMAMCVHESAHATVGAVLGAQLRNAVVTRSKVTGVEGLTTFAELPHGSDALIAYSGPYGEARFQAGGRRPTQRAMFAALEGCGRKDAAVLTAAGGTHTGMAAQPLIDRCWPAIIRVAQQLHRVAEVHHEDVLAALGVDDGGGLGSVQLAAIRSGCRMVPPLAPKRAVPA
ncbi:hypothetical protein [Mycobacterium vicinigordonae]|uniref:Peptidase M41 domain-containing protein n=1 Tax=Mycobacterium vicinigordonae TaxID=1719132 RepID=A0A7D6DVB2_9MYCO|nr:hypothetical protein [Mycobacterium vicinigordonae]QLL05587.1 hypothetical protein H0P51_17275 [Mycobacterium vicinigordonae]